jgi:RNA polymerase sigma-70 factor (ECF subfamily)
VLLQVMRKLSSYRGEAALPTWLHQVTVNTVLSHRRKRALRGRVPLRDARNGFESETDQSNAFRRSSQGPEDEVLGREKRKLIDRAITQLPKAYREVFHLADVEGLPNQEIGERLGLSLPAVKSRLRRARRLMRDRLAPHFEEISA